MKKNWFSKKNAGLKLKQKMRSGLEEKIAAQIEEAGVDYEYETLKLAYSIPHTYTPDFRLANGIIIEGKGLFDSSDRTKHLAVKKQHPELDIRFVFSRSASPLYKGSKSTYASWCAKNGFQYADKLIPEAWLSEEKK
jgi:hypothetical protein